MRFGEVRREEPSKEELVALLGVGEALVGERSELLYNRGLDELMVADCLLKLGRADIRS